MIAKSCRLLVLLAVLFPTGTNSQNYVPIAVIGSGYSGVYFTWRLTVDIGLVRPNDIQIFEAHPKRIGGRSYTVKGVRELGDMVLDIGGYNYYRNHEPLRTLIEDKLGFAWFAEDPVRRSSAMIRDTYGNNGGFVKPIELMIDQYNQNGGNKIEMNHKLIDIQRGTSQELPIQLIFENGDIWYTSNVFLNLPKTSLLSLSQDSVLFTEVPISPRVIEAYTFPVDFNSVKVFLVYDDAWWLTKLGHMDGEFNLRGNGLPPLWGDYYWGPVKCRLDDGNWATYRIPFGKNCTGAVRAYYIDHVAPQDEMYYYLDLQQNVDEPLLYINEKHELGHLLELNHIQMIEYHTEELLSFGVDPQSIEPPTAMVIANWNEKSDVMPAPNVINPSPDVFELVEIVKKPLRDFNIFVMNQAYANQGGIASPTLNRTDEIIFQYFV